MTTKTLLLTIFSVGYICAASSESEGALTVTDLLSREHDIKVQRIDGEDFLDLSRCGLTSLQGLEAIPRIASVQRLKLSHNKLRLLTKSDLACVPLLTNLHVDNNGLESIAEDTFADHHGLKGLLLMCNKLRDAAAVLNVFDRLEAINLAANQVISFEPTSKNENLRYLSLERNEGESIWGTRRRTIYECCPQLRQLPGSVATFFCCD